MLAGLLAEVIRTQLLNANGGFVAPETYNEVYSVHGSAMVWLVIIPLLPAASAISCSRCRSARATSRFRG